MKRLRYEGRELHLEWQRITFFISYVSNRRSYGKQREDEERERERQSKKRLFKSKRRLLNISWEGHYQPLTQALLVFGKQFCGEIQKKNT